MWELLKLVIPKANDIRANDHSTSVRVANNERNNDTNYDE